MAGAHHTRSSQNPMGNGSFGHHGLPAVQGQSATSRMPVAAVPYPSNFPFIHPLTNQVMMWAPSCLALPSTSMPLWMMAQHQIQAPPQAPLFCDTVVHSYTVIHHNAATAVVPSPRRAYPANQPPGVVQADLKLRLGSGGNNSHGDKRKLLASSLEDGRHGKRPVVAMDGGDQSGEEGDHADGLDLELRLYCR